MTIICTKWTDRAVYRFFCVSLRVYPRNLRIARWAYVVRSRAGFYMCNHLKNAHNASIDPFRAYVIRRYGRVSVWCADTLRTVEN